MFSGAMPSCDILLAQTRCTATGAHFFVDRNTRRIAFEDPRPDAPTGAMGVYGKPSVCWKLSQSKDLPSPIKIAVAAQILFEDSYRRLPLKFRVKKASIVITTHSSGFSYYRTKY
uniref:Uncharacterized protein n=1 Tax=Glossina austeni TaxID=7395 RepID=A0A1A9V903_GLOAU